MSCKARAYMQPLWLGTIGCKADTAAIRCLICMASTQPATGQKPQHATMRWCWPYCLDTMTGLVHSAPTRPPAHNPLTVGVGAAQLARPAATTTTIDVSSARLRPSSSPRNPQQAAPSNMPPNTVDVNRAWLVGLSKPKLQEACNCNRRARRHGVQVSSDDHMGCMAGGPKAQHTFQP